MLSESIIVAMKPIDKNFANNARVWGVSGLNVDGGRVEAANGEIVTTHSRGDNGAFPKRPGEKTAQESGRKKDQRHVDPNPRLGRFPANIIHDGSDEVEAEFAKAGVSKSTGGKTLRFNSSDGVYGFFKEKLRSNAGGLGDSGSASRFFKVCKPDNWQHTEIGNNEMTNDNNEIGVNKVIQGDCLDVMRQLPDNFIDTVITDPPYELDFMSKKWDNSGIAFNTEVWREALRVAKPGATLLAFGGTRTHHRLMVAIEDAGWEIRDCIQYLHDGSQPQQAFFNSLSDEQKAAYLELHKPNDTLFWVYGSGFPKSHNVSKALDKAAGAEREVVGSKGGRWNSDIPPNGNGKGFTRFGQDQGRTLKSAGYIHPERGAQITKPTTKLAKDFDGYGSALKPANEPIILAQKPLDGTYADNAEEWGVSGLNVDGGRVEGEERNKLEAGYIRNGRTDEEVFSTGYGRPKDNNGKVNGRFPANIIHDGSDEVEAEFAKAPYVQPCGSAKKTTHTGGMFGIGVPGIIYKDNNISPSRFFYCAKASRSERQPYNNHPTVKPLALLRYLAKLTCTPYGGIVLDMFGGSGTTALAAIAEQRDFILIEKNPDYVEIARRRIAEYSGEVVPEKEIKINKEAVRQMALW